MKEELTDFDIFQALDRTSVLINMVSETLGSVFIPEEDGGLDDVLPAVKKHYKLLENLHILAVFPLTENSGRVNTPSR